MGDPFGIRTETRHMPDGTFIINRVQDVEAVLERNKALYNAGDGYTPSRDLQYAASIPMVLVEKWLNEEGINAFDPNHKEAIRRKLNSSEYAYLRTSKGKL